MRVRLGVTILIAAAFGATATAASLSIANHSFETLPGGGLPTPCGGTCAYSVDVVPGWVTLGNTGQWIVGGYAGNPSATDGSVVAYSSGGSLGQDVATAVAGTTYLLEVDLMHRTDLPMAGVIQILLDGVAVATATGTDLGAGTWSTWSASYTAVGADVGKSVSVLLSASSSQGDFDNVRMDASGSTVPEPATTALMGAGLIALCALRRRLVR